MKGLKIFKNDAYEFCLYSLFLLPLTGSSIPAYIVALFYLIVKLNKIRFKLHDVFFLTLIIVWFLFKIEQSNVYASLVLLRYYFGFYIFYLFFNNIDFNFKLDKLLIIICSSVLIEAFLVNTIIKPEWLPNYPKGASGSVFSTKIMGFYQRPYSIGTSTTITSTIVMVLVFYVFAPINKILLKKTKRTLIISVITVVAIASGTGYMLLLLFFIYKTRPFKNIVYALISSFLMFILYYLIFIIDIGAFNGLEKISSTYLEFLYNFKIFQIDNVLANILTTTNELLIGNKYNSATELMIWSDFAWNNLFECTGYIGLGITVLFFLFKMNKYNYIPMFIFIIGAIHYGASYSLPGQMLIGYFLSSKFTNYQKNIVMYKKYD